MSTSADPTRHNRPEGRMTGGRALAEMLRLSGAGPMFGMGGFQLLPFYDALGQLGMRHFLINDERCGAFAADAYARVTNRPGICDGTLGPGATNLVTGLVESLNGGIPVVAIAGNTNRAHSWKNMTQECRQAEILKPAVKELIRVEQTVAMIRAQAPAAQIALVTVFAGRKHRPALYRIDQAILAGAYAADPEVIIMDPLTEGWRFPRARDGFHPSPQGDTWIANKVAGILQQYGVRPAPAGLDPALCTIAVRPQSPPVRELNRPGWRPALDSPSLLPVPVARVG